MEDHLRTVGVEAATSGAVATSMYGLRALALSLIIGLTASSAVMLSASDAAARARVKKSPAAELAKARTHLAAWQLDEAAAILKKSVPKRLKDEREVILAKLALQRSDFQGVIMRMRPLLGRAPMNFEARVLLGHAFLSIGQKQQGVKILDEMADFWNDGRVKTGPALMWLGVGLRLTEYFKNASEIFGDAVKADPNLHEARIRWAHLFIEKYNFRDSDNLFNEVLKANPKDPQAILGSALVDMRSDRKFIVAKKKLAKLLKDAPKNVPAHNLWALADLHHERPQDAIKRLHDHSLKIAPNNLEALTILGAAYYVADDLKGYRKTETRLRAVNHRYAKFYSEVSVHASRVHRYKEAIKLNETALQLDNEHWRAMANLGMGYSRIGNDRLAKEYLGKAFDGDPFDVRTYNLLEFFYDKKIKEFEWISAGPISIRAHKTEREMIERYVPDLLKEAYGFLVKKYAYKPAAPLNVEIFADKQMFAIRSIGLPNLGAHGICFGHVITARSPSAGNFNWAEVLWHELSHVFHIQLSDSRVPRWFTEGLAVYESTEARPEWRREMDDDMLEYLDGKKLRGVADFNLSFTQAKSFKDILVAYYHAYVVTDFIVKEFGFPKMRKLLVAWGARKTTAQAFKSVLGVTLSAFDKRFFPWLDKRLSYLRKNFRLNVGRYGDKPKKWLAAAKKRPQDAKAQAEAALAEAAGGKSEPALKFAEAALKLDPKQPQALLLRAKWRVKNADAAGAKADLQALLKQGLDSRSIRASLAKLAQAAKDEAGVAKHLEKALALAPQDGRMHYQLIKTLDGLGKKARAYEWRRKTLMVDQMNIRLIGELLAGAKQFKASKKDVLYWGEFGNHIAPFSAKHHVTFARELKRLGMHEQAAFEAESALIIEPNNAEAKGMMQ